MTAEMEHTGQHEGRCGKCNAWRYDRMMERKARIAAGESPDDVADENNEGWNWRRPEDEISKADADWANRVLSRCFKGSQGAFNNGMQTPGTIGITNFLVGLVMAMEDRDMARRLLGGVQKTSADATGQTPEQVERSMKEALAELRKSLKEEM